MKRESAKDWGGKERGCVQSSFWIDSYSSNPFKSYHMQMLQFLSLCGESLGEGRGEEWVGQCTKRDDKSIGCSCQYDNG